MFPFPTLFFVSLTQALATPAGGFSLGPEAPVSFGDFRTVAITGPGGDWMIQPTLRAGLAADQLSASVQVLRRVTHGRSDRSSLQVPWRRHAGSG